jgi:hypothetical protein
MFKPLGPRYYAYSHISSINAFSSNNNLAVPAKPHYFFFITFPNFAHVRRE